MKKAQAIVNSNVTAEEIKKAKFPHDLFLLNLIGNHILNFVATLGMATTWAWPMLIVPIVSFTIFGLIFFKGKKDRDKDSAFVKSHVDMAIRRSKFFLTMFVALSLLAMFGLYGHYGLGWMKEAVYALIGGGCILPIMVSTLVLIVVESDSLHFANTGQMANTKTKDPIGQNERDAMPDGNIISEEETNKQPTM